MAKYRPVTKVELELLVQDESIYLGDIDVSLITDMSMLFYNSTREDFSGIETWDVSHVKDMSFMFAGAKSFNQPIGCWDVSNVMNMSWMFCVAKSFNQFIGNWNVSNVKYMINMFAGARSFNQPIGNWDISKVENPDTYFVSFEEKFDKFLKEGKILYLSGFTDFDDIKIDPDELRILLFTSGTTGSAKGVCLSQRNICSNILSTYGIVKVKRSDLFFSVLPLHHTYECTLGFLLPIYSGASICHCEGLRYIAKNMQEFHPSVILCVPLLLEKLHKNIVKNMVKSLPEKYIKDGEDNPYHNLPSFMKKIVRTKVKNTLGGRLRVFIVGAAAANPNIVSDFRDLKLNTLQGYGLTECSPLVAGNTDFFQKDDSAGLPIPNVEYKIDNPNDEGIGEIIVKGPNVMLRLL